VLPISSQNAVLRFLLGWRDKLDGVRYESWTLRRCGEERLDHFAAEALAD
jgi:hypothetical protein